jgi:uncharacterized membrane protein HdeD (DUF308 family)
MDPSLSPDLTTRKNNPLAQAAGWLGIGSAIIALIGFVITIFFPIAFLFTCGLGILMDLVALVLGIIGLVQLKSHPEQKGKGMAILGIVFGAVAVILLCLSPVLVTAVLALLGPVIGNVFTKINSTLVAP